MPLNDLWEVKLFCKQDDQLAVNVLHYRTTVATPQEPGPVAVATQLDALFGPILKSLLNAFSSYTGATAQKIFPLPMSLTGTGAAATGVGTFGPDPGPSQVSGLIKKTTPFGGRKFRGRMYVPYPARSAVNSAGHPTAAYLAALENLRVILPELRVIIDGADAITLAPTIKNRVPAGSNTLITGATLRDRWATQRRRGGVNRADF